MQKVDGLCEWGGWGGIGQQGQQEVNQSRGTGPSSWRSRKWGVLEAGKLVRCALFYRRKIWGMEELSFIQDLITCKSQRGYQFSSVTQLCLTLWNPMNRSMPGLPVHHQLLELTQTHVHQVGDAIQPSHPLLSPCPPALKPFTWSGQSIVVPALASVLPNNIQDWSLEWTGWISLQSNGLSRVLSNTTVQKHQFLGAQLSSQSTKAHGNPHNSVF